MGQDSKIEWTDHTFNPWIGCAHREIDGEPHPGCENCYAEAMMAGRWKKVNWGPAGTRIMTSPANWAKPIAWNKAAEKAGVRARVFCASLADVFEDWHGAILSHRVIHDPACPENGNQETDFNPVLWHRDDIGICEAGQTTVDKCRGERLATMDDVRRKLFELILRTPWLDWLLLTKRPENPLRMWPRHLDGGDDPKLWSMELGERDGDRGSIPRQLRNVWLGTSVSNQKTADRLIPELLKCHELAPVLFLSAEPLVGPLDLRTLFIPDRSGFWNAFDGRYAFKATTDAGQEFWCETEEPLRGHISQVIVGGESGLKGRSMHPAWPRALRDQCQAAGVAFFFKQWGEWAPAVYGEAVTYHAGYVEPNDQAEWSYVVNGMTCAKGPKRLEAEGFAYMDKVGKKAAGRMLDGREWSEFPRVAEGAAL